MNDILRGERVRLTIMRPDDAGVMAQWWDAGDFMRHLDAIPAVPKSEAQLAKWIERSVESPNSFLFGIRRLEGDRLIGYLELDGILWTHGATSFSILIGDPLDRGQGYGEEALRIGLRFAFDELNLHRVALTVFDYNTAAIRMYERLGFVHEGAHREFLQRDGQRHDMLLYGLLRREWEAHHSADR